MGVANSRGSAAETMAAAYVELIGWGARASRADDQAAVRPRQEGQRCALRACRSAAAGGRGRHERAKPRAARGGSAGRAGELRRCARRGREPPEEDDASRRPAQAGRRCGVPGQQRSAACSQQGGGSARERPGGERPQRRDDRQSQVDVGNVLQGKAADVGYAVADRAPEQPQAPETALRSIERTQPKNSAEPIGVDAMTIELPARESADSTQPEPAHA